MVGLLAHPLIERLIRREPDVKAHIGEILRGNAEPVFNVIVPAQPGKTVELKGRQVPALDAVTLRCEKVDVLNGLMRERAVRVTASPAHMELLQAIDRRRAWATQH